MLIVVEGSSKDSQSVLQEIDAILSKPQKGPDVQLKSNGLARSKPIDGAILVLVISAIGAFSSGVASGVVANWIWENLKNRKGRDLDLRVYLSDDGAVKKVELSGANEEQIRVEIERFFDR